MASNNVQFVQLLLPHFEKRKPIPMFLRCRNSSANTNKIFTINKKKIVWDEYSSFQLNPMFCSMSIFLLSLVTCYTQTVPSKDQVAC